MRIGSYTQIQQIYNTTKPSNVSKTQKKGFSDALSISGAGKDMQTAKAALSETPDIRKDLVNDIKARIDAGTYGVSGDSFADKLVEKFSQSAFAL